MDFCIQDVIQVSGEEEIFDGILVGDGIPRQIIYRTLEEEGLAETFFGHLFFGVNHSTDLIADMVLTFYFLFSI